MAYLNLSVVCLSQQSGRVKLLNDSPGWPVVPMAASEAASGPGRKVDWRKKSNVGQHKLNIFKKKKKRNTVRTKSGAHSPFPLLLLVALSRELILERPRKESEGSVAVKETKISEEKINSFHDSKLT